MRKVQSQIRGHAISQQQKYINIKGGEHLWRQFCVHRFVQLWMLILCDFDSNKSEERWGQTTESRLYWVKGRDTRWFTSHCSTSPTPLPLRITPAVTHHPSWFTGCNIRHPCPPYSPTAVPPSCSCCQCHSWSTSAHSWPDITAQPHLQSMWEAEFSLWGISLHEPTH